MKLINSDCIIALDELCRNGTFVDACITDIPYGETRSKWDSTLDMDSIWKFLKKLVKPSGAIILFGNEPYSSVVRMSNQDDYKYDIKWIKNRATGFANANYRPMRKYEDIMVFSQANASAGGKSNHMVYNPQGLVEINRKKKNHSNRFGLIDKGNVNRGQGNIINSNDEYVQKFTNYPSNVVEFECESKYVHPTQKPIALMEYLVKTYSNEGDTVLDFTMGSGTTGVACINTNRDFIGIEIDSNYFNIASERLNNIKNKHEIDK